MFNFFDISRIIMNVKGGNTMNYARWSTKEELLKVLKEIAINSSIQKSGNPMG